jgi:hypothetical protein
MVRIAILVALREVLAAAAGAVPTLALTVALGGPMVTALAIALHTIALFVGSPLRAIVVNGPLTGPRRIVIRHVCDSCFDACRLCIACAATAIDRRWITMLSACDSNGFRSAIQVRDIWSFAAATSLAR